MEIIEGRNLQGHKNGAQLTSSIIFFRNTTKWRSRRETKETKGCPCGLTGDKSPSTGDDGGQRWLRRKQKLHSISIPSLTARQANELLAPISSREIEEAVFQIQTFKSPGQDGFPAAFFHRHWNIVKEDIGNMIRPLLENLISPNQNAFVKGESGSINVNSKFWPFRMEGNSSITSVSDLITFNDRNKRIKDHIDPSPIDCLQRSKRQVAYYIDAEKEGKGIIVKMENQRNNIRRNLRLTDTDIMRQGKILEIWKTTYSHAFGSA
ncbi:RNA-directed DNA polymerase [Senna tora]|uniref:RNA-directed DNA polymerase n=1 Tax=Senna tora TaxID=362788 RepID=A0A834XII9_9FABA|nr:RNA-directed DNA polymerase [Senna tora]